MSKQLLLPAAALACALGLLLPSPLRAQSDGVGSVTGRVQNADTARYLGHARIRLAGTARETLTDDSGHYRFDNVPAGTAVVNAFYTGLAPQQASVTVPPGGVATRDFVLRNPGAEQAAGLPEGDVVALNPFLVQSERETNAQTLAINEQRFAPNIMDVVSTDAYGEINQGNIGEFVKHIPGVNIEFKDGNNPSGIDVRGFGSNYTRVTVDGNTIASAAIGNTQTPNRQFVLEGASINSYSRIEVTKEPLPRDPANTMGGSVNLVSKSAFEYAKPMINFEAYGSGNSYGYDFGKVGGVDQNKHHEVVPSFDGTIIEPISDKLGVVITAADYDQFYTTKTNAPVRTFTSNGATVANPYTQSFTASAAPNEVRSVNGSVKFDWKPAEGSLLSLTALSTAYRQDSAKHSIGYNTGPSPISWGETFTDGTVGKASAPSMGGGWQNRNALTQFLGLNYRLDTGPWQVALAATYSNSDNRIRDTDKGFFNSVSTGATAVKTIDFNGFDNGTASIGQLTTLDASGKPVDTTQLANYNMTQVGSQPATNRDTVREYRADVTRAFDNAWVPVSVSIGGDTNALQRDLHYSAYNYTYLGPDGVAASGDEGMAGLADPTYNQSPGFGLPTYQWVSPWAVYNLFKTHPGYFTQTATQQGDVIKNIATRSPLLMERVSAGYAMLDFKLFHNRLRVVGGVRYELTQDQGYGYRQDANAIYVKDANGIPVSKNGAFVLLPSLAGTVAGGPQQNALIYQYRGNYNARDYHGYYKDLSTTYQVTDDFLIRGAYAETMGRPSPSDIVPNNFVSTNATFDSTVSGSFPGSISSSNTSLVPWTAKNYDLSLEYYLPHNGLAEIGIFRKDVRNFFSTLNEVATIPLLDSLGLSHDYVGYQYSTRVNGGNARIDGVELSYTQELDFIPGFGRYFTVLGNVTKFTVTGTNGATFDLKNGGGNIPLTGNAGVHFSKGRFAADVNWNYRGEQFRDTSSAYPGALENVGVVTQWDADLEYRLTKHVMIFVAGRNLNNGVTRWTLDGPGAPQWSHLENYYTNGAQYSFGARASF